MSRPPHLIVALTPHELRTFLPEPLLGRLRALAPDAGFIDPTGLDAPEFGRRLAAANPDVLLTCWKTPSLPTPLPPRLAYVCHLAGTVKALITRQHLEQGLVVTNWGASISRTVAEAALLHILTCLRRTSHWAIAMHQPGTAAWKDAAPATRSLFGRSVGLHGFGPVARALVRLLQPWECRISAFAPDLTDELARTHGVGRAPSLEALFSDHEVLVELAPLTAATRGIVDGRLLRLIPPGGVFVNVGRGAVVDEAALLEVAREGRLRVGLDVFATEPLPADSGFRALPEVSLTPHLAGPTPDRCPDAGEFALRNLAARLQGRPLEAVVTPEVYDRST